MTQDAAPEADPAQAFAACLALLRAGDPRAGAVLALCSERFPDHAEGWTTLGRALSELKRHEAALVCFERGRRVAPTAERAILAGMALRDLGRHEAARSAFAEATALDPTSVRARFLEGVAAQDAGDFAGAAAAYAGALALEPGLAEAALNLGTARQAMGDVAGARDAYARAVRLKPDSFGRAAQALTTARTGELWLDLDALRAALGSP